jgi:hypothetical protein
MLYNFSLCVNHSSKMSLSDCPWLAFLVVSSKARSLDLEWVLTWSSTLVGYILSSDVRLG